MTTNVNIAAVKEGYCTLRQIVLLLRQLDRAKVEGHSADQMMYGFTEGDIRFHMTFDSDGSYKLMMDNNVDFYPDPVRGEDIRSADFHVLIDRHVSILLQEIQERQAA